ncbi:Uncharacterised protein [Chryseobacterium nakagawai]|uniref:Uncharacterized protein n=1 Tax=Chryseobacterium nakagawai TaxID=1241982 RepID=A0AAD0YMI9_CHRNA|nr:hypothetical protein [Chryseobacterium nakagawai]AZA91183.1 hypothetical protein EG343_11345 [Chryseobacterium nakagawai]VEH22748.1 Uncharacterised protein [Chryseobacterium nakagawai]
MTKVPFISPIQQILVQNLVVDIDTEEKKFCETELTICEDEKISLDLSLEISIDYHPEYGRSAKKTKVHYLGGYDSRENEELDLSRSEIKYIEKYLSENLTINI